MAKLVLGGQQQVVNGTMLKRSSHSSLLGGEKGGAGNVLVHSIHRMHAAAATSHGNKSTIYCMYNNLMHFYAHCWAAASPLPSPHNMTTTRMDLNLLVRCPPILIPLLIALAAGICFGLPRFPLAFLDSPFISHLPPRRVGGGLNQHLRWAAGDVR